MPHRPSLSLVLLLAAAHVALVPALVTALTLPASSHWWAGAGLALCATQIGLLTVWLNLATSRWLPACCVIAVIAVWGLGLAPLVGLRMFLHSVALLMTQLSILAQLSLLRLEKGAWGTRQTLTARLPFQFSLRSLLIATLAVSVLLGYPQWLAQLRAERVPVVSVTAASSVVIVVLLMTGVVAGFRGLIISWAGLCLFTLVAARSGVDVEAWMKLTAPGFCAEAAFVLGSVWVVQIAGWPITRSNSVSLLTWGARRVELPRSWRRPQSAAP